MKSTTFIFAPDTAKTTKPVEGSQSSDLKIAANGSQSILGRHRTQKKLAGQLVALIARL